MMPYDLNIPLEHWLSSFPLTLLWSKLELPVCQEVVEKLQNLALKYFIDVEFHSQELPNSLCNNTIRKHDHNPLHFLHRCSTTGEKDISKVFFFYLTSLVSTFYGQDAIERILSLEVLEVLKCTWKPWLWMELLLTREEKNSYKKICPGSWSLVRPIWGDKAANDVNELKEFILSPNCKESVKTETRPTVFFCLIIIEKKI